MRSFAFIPLLLTSFVLVLAGCGRSELIPVDIDGGVVTACHTNADCSGTPATPVCDTTSGTCVAGCFSDAISLSHYTNEQLMAQLEGMLI